MATIKMRDIKNLSDADREKKLKELRLELVKSKVNASKTGNAKARELRKIIARITTFNKSKGKTKGVLKK